MGLMLPLTGSEKSQIAAVPHPQQGSSPSSTPGQRWAYVHGHGEANPISAAFVLAARGALSRHISNRSSTTEAGAEDNLKAMRKRHINRSKRNIKAGRAAFHVRKHKTTARRSWCEPWCSGLRQVITARAAPELHGTHVPHLGRV